MLENEHELKISKEFVRIEREVNPSLRPLYRGLHSTQWFTASLRVFFPTLETVNDYTRQTTLLECLKSTPNGDDRSSCQTVAVTLITLKLKKKICILYPSTVIEILGHSVWEKFQRFRQKNFIKSSRRVLWRTRILRCDIIFSRKYVPISAQCSQLSKYLETERRDWEKFLCNFLLSDCE